MIKYIIRRNVALKNRTKDWKRVEWRRYNRKDKATYDR